MFIFLSHITALIKWLLFIHNKLDQVTLIDGKNLRMRAFHHPVLFDLVGLSIILGVATIVFNKSSISIDINLVALIFLSYVYTSVTGQNNTFRRSQTPPFRRFLNTFIQYHFPYWIFPITIFLYDVVNNFYGDAYSLVNLPERILALITWYSVVATVSIYSYMVLLYSSYFSYASQAFEYETMLIEGYQNDTFHNMGHEARGLLRINNLFSIRNIILHWVVFVFFLLNLSIMLSLVTYFLDGPFSNAFSFISGFWLLCINVFEALAGFSFDSVRVHGLKWVEGIWKLRTFLVVFCIGYPVACLLDLSFTGKKIQNIVNRYWEKSDESGKEYA